MLKFGMHVSQLGTAPFGTVSKKIPKQFLFIPKTIKTGKSPPTTSPKFKRLVEISKLTYVVRF